MIGRAPAALVQWDLENVSSYFAFNPGLAGPDTLTGSFTYNTANNTIPTWDITSTSFGTLSNATPGAPFPGLPSNDSATGEIGFGRVSGVEFFFVTLALPSPDILLLSGLNPIDLLNTTSSVVTMCCGFDYTGTLVNDSLAPLPSALPLFAAAILALGAFGYRRGRAVVP